MHRRGYIPGSHIKVSRTKLAQENNALRGFINNAVAQQHIARERQEQERIKAETTGIRGFINKAKRLLTQPIALKRSA